MAKIKLKFVDGTEQVVTTNLVDQIAWEDTARARRWPIDSPIRGGAFISWTALVRQELHEGPFEEFIKTVESLNEVEEEDEGTDSPTLPAQ